MSQPDRSPGLVDADKQYGETLAMARRQVGLSQDELARRAGLSDGTGVARIEAGARRPRLATQERLAMVIKELQEAQVKPRMITLLRLLVEYDQKARENGTELPAGWTEIMQRVDTEAQIVGLLGRNRHKRADTIRRHLKVLNNK